MKRRRQIILAGVAVVLIGFAAYKIATHRSPLVWNGKPASYWIGRLSFADLNNGQSSAEEFVFAAGPGVVKELIEGLGRRDNRFSDWWTATYLKLGKWQRFFDLPVKRSHFRASCARGLGMLGTAASEAEPALVAALNETDTYVRSAATAALGRVSTNKASIVPALVAGVGSQDANFRLACVLALTRCIPESPDAAVALRRIAKDPDSNLRAWAVASLWKDLSNPQLSFNILVEALSDSAGAVRTRAADSIGMMRHAPESAALVLQAALNETKTGSPDPILAWKILGAIAEIGPPARALVPDLVELIDAKDSHLATRAAIALGRIEPDNPRWVDELIRQLEPDPHWAAWELGRRGDSARRAVEPLLEAARRPSHWTIQAMAATAAWRLAPKSPNPIGMITNQLTHEDRGGYEIVQLLGELGPAAESAVPTLLQLRYSRGDMMREYVNGALEKIAPEFLNDPWRK